MPGYSGTPLFKKLGIKDGIRVSLLGMPADVRAELKAALSTCEMDRNGKKLVDFILCFAKSKAGLDDFDRLVKSLAPDGMIWISWPKKSSGVPTDLDENKVRNIGLAGGLVDVKVCAITDVWSGLKFVRRLKDR
ncbi:MAG TPA: DUF3052 family protein [Candidatus Sulfotelmatobacter sp.]